MRKIIVVQRANGYSVDVVTGSSIDTLWGKDSGLLEDAIRSAATIAHKLNADNAQAWSRYIEEISGISIDEAALLQNESCLDYAWAFDPQN